MSGTKPYQPSNEEGSSNGNTGCECVRANAVTPQPDPGPSKPNQHGDKWKPRGQKLNCAKQDELRAEGKCFQCEKTGHSQKDCPDLNTMRPRGVVTANMNIACLERLVDARDRADLQVGSMVLGSGLDDGEETTPTMRRAYEQCTEAWGKDERWLNPESQADSRYGIYQFVAGPGKLVKVTDHDYLELGIVEIDVTQFRDPNFRLISMFPMSTNTNQSCVREGGFRDRKNYKVWQWTVLKWLRNLMDEQIGFENSSDVIIVQPSMKGYCLNIKGTDVYYEVTHAEVLGDMFNIRHILTLMRNAGKIDTDAWPNIFKDTGLNRQQSIMLHATRLMVGAVKQRRHNVETEGTSSIEKTSMQVKDQSRKVPEPVVVLAEINGHQVWALVDTGSMADFISMTVVEQLRLLSSL